MTTFFYKSFVLKFDLNRSETSVLSGHHHIATPFFFATTKKKHRSRPFADRATKSTDWFRLKLSSMCHTVKSEEDQVLNYICPTRGPSSIPSSYFKIDPTVATSAMENSVDQSDKDILLLKDKKLYQTWFPVG